ncbi:MAG: EAL domain-containing protein [Pseudomonadota bacterium]
MARILEGDQHSHQDEAGGATPPVAQHPFAYGHAIFESAAEGILVIDGAGRIQIANPAAAAIFGATAESLQHAGIDELIPTFTAYLGALRTATSPVEIKGRRRTGEELPLSLHVRSMNIDGQEMFSAFIEDISEQRLMRGKLFEAEMRFRDLIETAHDLVWSMDTEGRWTYLNSACEQIYGHKPQEMLGRHFHEFQAPEYRERDAKALLDLLSGKDIVHYETVHLNRKGEQRYLSFNGKTHHDEHGRIQWISGTARDITEQKLYQQQLYYQAQHDVLTGLYNRNYFQQELGRVIAQVARSGAEYALFYIDLDQFKFINDTLGHAAGDKLLIECTRMLKRSVREGDLVARFGGDEFTILLYNIDRESAEAVAEKLRQCFEDFKFLEGGNSFNVTCSIGAAMIDSTVQSMDEAMMHADLACHIAKSEGRNKVMFYDSGHNNMIDLAEDMGWASRVREAVDRGLFRMVYQPIFSLNGEGHGYEVLLRMLHRDGSEIKPGGFIPAAERFGLIHSVDRWLVAQAIDKLAEMNRDTQSPVYFSINLSGRAFEDELLLPLIHRKLDETGVDPGLLTFEITETAAINKLSAAVRFIEGLKKLGCKFALDDFGAGFCSFTYLKHLPVDKVKIDGSFINGLASSEVDQAMVQSMAQIARALGKQTVAEAVEDADTLRMLREIGVDYAQGYYLGLPVENLEIEQLSLKWL